MRSRVATSKTAKIPWVRTDPKAQLAFIAMNKEGVVAAVLRTQKKVFRYALMRGTKTPPVLVDVKPLIT